MSHQIPILLLLFSTILNSKFQNNLRKNVSSMILNAYHFMQYKLLISFEKIEIHWFIDLSPLPRGPHGKMNNTTND